MTDPSRALNTLPLHPLPLHMANSMALWSSAPLASMTMQTGTLPMHPLLQGMMEDLKAQLSPDDWLAFHMAVASGSTQRTQDFLSGVAAYQNSQYARPLPKADTVFTCGSMTVFDYGGTKDSVPILLVPSLINPSYVLDMMPDRSLVAHFKACGYRPLLLDWESPQQDELTMDVDAYVRDRLLRALDFACDMAEQAIPVLGYCMGGTLVTALACLAPQKISALMLLAAPWDFTAEPDHSASVQAHKLGALLKAMPITEKVPFELLQSYFASLDPALNDKKFRDFSRLDPDSERAKFFVAMENWANSGPPLTGPVARQAIVDWHEKNAPGKGEWVIDGVDIDAAKITAPAFVVCPEKDRLVPPLSAKALADLIPSSMLHDPKAGHVGMIVGSRAKTGLFNPMTDWLQGVLS